MLATTQKKAVLVGRPNTFISGERKRDIGSTAPESAIICCRIFSEKMMQVILNASLSMLTSQARNCVQKGSVQTVASSTAAAVPQAGSTRFSSRPITIEEMVRTTIISMALVPVFF